jgi:hypothetical protein
MTVQHISDLTWDRQLAGDLPAELSDQVLRHTAECALCAARGAQLEADLRRFQASPPSLLAPCVSAPQTSGEDSVPRPRNGAAAAPRATPWWHARWAIPAAAAVVAVAVVPQIVARRLAGDQGGAGSAPTARSKGGFAVMAFAGRDRDVVTLGPGDPIFPGDRLQLSYSAEQAGHLAVLAIDGAGAVSVYFPPDAATTWPAVAGQRIALPMSTALDDIVGEERLWIVHCSAQQPLAPLVARLTVEGVNAEAPVDCEVQRLSFDKHARAGVDQR